jgi:hypothetical protein
MSRRPVVRGHVQGALFAAVALMLAPQAATAQCRQPCGGCQMYQPCPPCHPYHPSHPYHPQYPPHRPGDPGAKAKPKDPMDPGAKQPPDQGDQPQDQQPQQPQPQPQNVDTSPSTAQAGGYQSSNSTILGRVDQNNRLNLFDSMAAQPMNRWWFSWLPQKRYHTNIVEGSSANLALRERLGQHLYRLGGELIIHDGVSVAVQGQYSTLQGSENGFDDTFTNPQVMIKSVLACDARSILSGTFAFQPEIGTDDASTPGINEDTWRLYPGLLYFEDLGGGWFMQDGVQAGIPTESDQITTLDWAVSFGNWVYRDPYLDCSTRRACCCCYRQPMILGVIAQVEFFGKHVLGDRTMNHAFGVPNLRYVEDRTVIDATAGVQVLMADGLWVSVAASLPLTSDDVREVEGIITIGQRW